MNRLWISRIVIVLLLMLVASAAVTAVAAAYQPNAIYIGGQQTVTLVCKGDEFLTTIVSNREIILTCRVWVR